MVSNPSIWAVVPCFNRTVNTLRFLSNFARQDYSNKHVVIVDDGSSDNTGFNVMMNFPEAHFVFGDGNLWWSGGTNLGVKYALEHGADYILTINDDSQFSDNLLTTLYKTANLDENFIVGAVLVEEGNDNIIWSVGSSHDFDVQRLMRLNHSGETLDILKELETPYPVEMMPGNGVLIPQRVFELAGYFDEVNFPQYHADSEFVKRAQYFDFKPVIALDAIIVNQILCEPLVDNVKDLIFCKKSDLYWPALATFFCRFYPNVSMQSIFSKLYSHFGV